MSKKEKDTESALPEDEAVGEAPENESVTETEPEPEQVSDAEAAAEPEQEPEPEAAAEPEQGPEPEAAAESEQEAKPEPAEEPARPTESEPAPTAAARGKGAGGIAWLALFLSLLALAATGYMQVNEWRAQGDAEQSDSLLAELRSRIAASNESLANLDRGLADLAAADTRTAAELETLQNELEQRMQLLDSLPPRVSSVERSMSALQGVSASARETWLLAEAEHYMQIANAQLQLAGNPYLAAQALRMADERLVQLANPALIDVRRALSDELAALDGMEKPDIEGATLNLASLARVVESLPLRQVDTGAADEQAGADDELSGFARAWASVKGAASGLVRVTGPEQMATPLLTPDAIYFLRTNLTLQLQTARLAMLRGEQAVFEQSLDDAAAWLRQYFDTESAQVASALETIAEIRNTMFAGAAPDISASLRLLREFRTINESAQ